MIKKITIASLLFLTTFSAHPIKFPLPYQRELVFAFCYAAGAYAWIKGTAKMNATPNIYWAMLQGAGFGAMIGSSAGYGVEIGFELGKNFQKNPDKSSNSAAG